MIAGVLLTGGLTLDFVVLLFGGKVAVICGFLVPVKSLLKVFLASPAFVVHEAKTCL